MKTKPNPSPLKDRECRVTINNETLMWRKLSAALDAESERVQNMSKEDLDKL